MKNIILISIFSFFSFSSVFGEEANWFHPPEYPNGLYLEVGGGKKSDSSSWIELGMLGSPSDFIEYRASFSHLGIKKNNDKNYFTGLNLGTRIKYSSFITPFLGVGFFAGYLLETNEDDEDDEQKKTGIYYKNDEKKEYLDDIIYCFYPEAGFYFQFKNNSKIYLSSKYMITSEKIDDFFLFTIGFSFTYE